MLRTQTFRKNRCHSLQHEVKAKVRRKLSVVEEEDVNRSRRLSSTSSIPEKNKIVKRTTTTTKTLTTSIANPPPALTPVLFREAFAPSAPPLLDLELPEGVICIDPPDDPIYENARDNYKYMKSKESDWIVDSDRLTEGCPKMERLRSVLIDWLISVVHCFRMSQETLYHTISLIDRTLAIRSLDLADVQLLGVSALLIASKLEEYFPADVGKMVRMTGDTYEPARILHMESKLLKLHNFDAYGAEPMIFINRFIRAARRESDPDFREVVLFCFDSVLTDKRYSEYRSSLLSAAAVYVALCLTDNEEEEEKDPWTKSMEYHTEYRCDETFLNMAKTVIKAVLEIKVAEKGVLPGVTRKYRSTSLHRNIANSQYLQTSEIYRVLRNLNNRQLLLQS